MSALEDAGFENPTPVQEKVFPVIRSGKDMVGIAQTGTGKTLAYLIPILMKLHYAQGKYPGHWSLFRPANWWCRCVRVLNC